MDKLALRLERMASLRVAASVAGFQLDLRQLAPEEQGVAICRDLAGRVLLDPAAEGGRVEVVVQSCRLNLLPSVVLTLIACSELATSVRGQRAGAA